MSFLARILLRMFGRPQGMLGRLGGIIMARMNRNLAGRTIALLDVQPHDRVLKIGFGPGVGIELLSGVVSSGHVAGADVSEEMVEQARMRNVEAIQRGKVELRRGSVEALPFAPEMFDKAMAINAMQVWPDAVAGLREIWRVLKPGGRVALGFTPYAGQPRAGLTDVLTTAGFAGAQVIDIERDFCALAIKSWPMSGRITASSPEVAALGQSLRAGGIPHRRHGHVYGGTLMMSATFVNIDTQTSHTSWAEPPVPPPPHPPLPDPRPPMPPPEPPPEPPPPFPPPPPA